MALQGNAPLNKFSLKCIIGSNPSRVNSWILNVLERGVVELDLYIASEYYYTLPAQVLMSKTLVRLKIAGTNAFSIYVREVFLPKLKTLHMSDVSFYGESGDVFAKLTSGCDALEELVMINLWVFGYSSSVFNPNLKKVTIYCDNNDVNPKSVSFDTPNLVYLEYTGTVAAEYPKVNFDSLVEARIWLQMTIDQLVDARDQVAYGHGYSFDMIENAADFLMGISNVKILYLSPDTLQVLAFCGKTFPVFNNLLHLTIETEPDVEWEAMPNLLENCPILETLVFKGLYYKYTNQCWDISHRFKDRDRCSDEDFNSCVCKPWPGTPIWLSSSPVKILKVWITNDIDDMDKQVEMFKYFLETMSNLEEVILYYDTPFVEDLRAVLTQFQKLGNVASSKCKIQVISGNVSFSFTVYYSSSSSRSGLVLFKNTFQV